MATLKSYSSLVNSPSATTDYFHSIISRLNPNLLNDFHFVYDIQQHNLQVLVKEALQRIDSYEQIYAYIKELCQDQVIDPSMYHEIQNVLLWALSKGRGKKNSLGEEIRDAWITYIVMLSCAMIDKPKEEKGSSRDYKGRKRKYLLNLN